MKKYITIKYKQYEFQNEKDLEPTEVKAHEAVPCNFNLSSKDKYWTQFRDQMYCPDFKNEKYYF